MKTIAYTALHYGKDYLASAIRSVIDAVDEHHVLYTPTGSHGHASAIPCPESREELYEIARKAAGDKFHWHEGAWSWEGQQRDAIHTLVPDADVVLVVDADEVWSEGLATSSIHQYELSRADRHIWYYKRIRIPMIHAWRSFNRWVLHDPAFPERVIYPNADGNEKDTRGTGMIFHFGYAQRPEIVEYKQHVHGHKSEWRRDVDWFRDKFMANAQHDCHPVGSDYWNPEQVDPFALGLPEWMREHPYANLKLIVDEPETACPRCGSDQRVSEDYGDFHSFICLDCGNEYEDESEVIE